MKPMRSRRSTANYPWLAGRRIDCSVTGYEPSGVQIVLWGRATGGALSARLSTRSAVRVEVCNATFCSQRTLRPELQSASMAGNGVVDRSGGVGFEADGAEVVAGGEPDVGVQCCGELA